MSWHTDLPFLAENKQPRDMCMHKHLGEERQQMMEWADWHLSSPDKGSSHFVASPHRVRGSQYCLLPSHSPGANHPTTWPFPIHHPSCLPKKTLSLSRWWWCGMQGLCLSSSIHDLIGLEPCPFFLLFEHNKASWRPISRISSPTLGTWRHRQLGTKNSSPSWGDHGGL